MTSHKEYYKVVASPSPSYDEFCESMYAHGSSMHQKCFNYALTNLLFSLCRSILIINLLAIRLSLHLEALARLFTFKVL
jgi:hypothetical protein